MANKKEKFSISISKALFDEIEIMRQIKLGDREIIDDRSNVCEKLMIEGLRKIKIEQKLIESLDSLPFVQTNKLKLEKLFKLKNGNL